MSHIRERECSERAESGEQRKLLIMFVRNKIIPKIEVTLELNIHFSSWWCTKNCNSRLWLPSVGLLCQSWMTRTELCKAAERHGRDVQSTGKSAQLCTALHSSARLCTALLLPSTTCNFLVGASRLRTNGLVGCTHHSQHSNVKCLNEENGQKCFKAALQMISVYF